MKKEVVVGTRGSPLALWQANFVADELKGQGLIRSVTLKKIKTTGDKILDSPLARIGDKGLFVKEIENALLHGDVDLAVHSMKDIPTEVPEGLVIAVAVKREDPRDALVSKDDRPLEELPAGATIGTSSLRRRAQLLAFRSDFRFVDLRGNIETRLRKLHEQGLDAIVLSGAGLARLGLEDRITERVSPEIVLPAVGQGTIAVEARKDDRDLLELCRSLNDLPTWQAVTAERAFLKVMEGGCQVPLGALATIEDGILTLAGAVASLDGSKLVRDSSSGGPDEAEKVGMELARKLLESGARDILEEIR